MGANKSRYNDLDFNCAQIIYKRIAFLKPAMIQEGFTIDAIKEITELHSLIEWHCEDDLDFDTMEIQDLIRLYFHISDTELIEKAMKAMEERLSPKGDARALRLQEALSKKTALAPITRLGLYYLFEIESDVINEEVNLWLSKEPHGEKIRYKGDYVRYAHLELLINNSKAQGKSHAVDLIQQLKTSMEMIDAKQFLEARQILRWIYKEMLTENGRFPVHIKTLQYCAELFLDCGEPIPALKSFLHFSYRVRQILR